MLTATKNSSRIAVIGDVIVDAAASDIKVGGKLYPLAHGFADFPTPGGYRLTKPPGPGADIAVTNNKGEVKSKRIVGGKVKSTTGHIRKRQQRPLPKQTLWNIIQGFCPSVENWHVTCADNHPVFPGLGKLHSSGDVEVDVGGQRELVPWGKPVVGLDITARNGEAWTFSMSKACAEFRRRNQFVRARFDGRSWQAFCQLERAPLNVNLDGIILRPKGAILVVGSPHSFVVRPSDTTCKVRVGNGGLLDVRPDCWVNYWSPSGNRLTLIWLDGAWRIATCGPHLFHMHPMFSDEKQQVATGAHNLLEMHRDGFCKIQGSGLSYPPDVEISFSTPDFTAYRPPGPDQLLVVSDGKDEVAAQYAPSLIVEQTQWYCGYLNSEPTTSLSPTPLLLIILAVFLYVSGYIICHGGLILWLALMLSLAQWVSVFWLMIQGFRLAGILAGDAVSALWRPF